MQAPKLSSHFLITLISLVIVTLTAASYWFYVVEDAYISFRYARNLLTTGELSYNQGDRTEGYTNFLWVVLLAAGYPLFGFPDAARYIGLCLSITSLLLISMVFLRSPGNRNAGSLAAMLLAACPGFALWTVAGLETSLFICMMVAAVAVDNLAIRKSDWLCGLFFGLATLTRPEGMLFFIFYIIPKFLFNKSEMYRAARYLAGFASIVIPHLIFRWIYYNNLIPNTFWVKSKRFQGGGPAYFKRYLALTGAVWIPYLIYVLPRYLKNRIIWSFLAPSAAYYLYVFHIGGDWMPMGRFLIPALPFIFLACTYAGHNNRSAVSRIIFCLFFFFNIFIMAASFQYDSLRLRPTRYHDILRWDYEHYQDWKTIGLFFRDYASREQVLCTGLGGIIPYYSELKTIDRGGLNDREIARIIAESKSQGDESSRVDRIILQRRPDFILDEIEAFQLLKDHPNLITPGSDRWPASFPRIFEPYYDLKTVKIADRYFSFLEIKPHN